MEGKYIAVALAMLFGSLAFVPSAASAAKPLDVNCDVLKSALITIDELAAEIFPEPLFKNWGQVVSTVKSDQQLFELLTFLVVILTEGQIVFTDPNQAQPTIAKCGLSSLQVHNVNNSGPPN